MSLRVAAWKWSGILAGAALLALAVRWAAVPAWKSRTDAIGVRDSLDRRMTRVGEGIDSTGLVPRLPDPAASVRAVADSLRVKVGEIQTSRISNGVELRIQARTTFPDLVRWMGALEHPRLPCAIRSWEVQPVDRRGGDVDARLLLECEEF